MYFNDNSNPYYAKSDIPKLKLSVVAFVDILGYQNLIRDAQRNNTSQELLGNLHDALSKAVGELDWNIKVPSNGRLNLDSYKIRTFTDNIVIGYPIRKDAEDELSIIFGQLASFQLSMVNQGYFIRGAIAIGDFYIDDLIIFGEGLIDSYDGESKQALNPRIILTKSAQQKVEKHLYNESIYDKPTRCSHTRHLYKDADGFFFLNYLDIITIGEDDLQFIDYLENHRDVVEHKLKKYCNESCITKYIWSASYHNFFCDQHPDFEEYKIDLSRFRLFNFSKISE